MRIKFKNYLIKTIINNLLRKYSKQFRLIENSNSQFKMFCLQTDAGVCLSIVVSLEKSSVGTWPLYWIKGKFMMS